MSRIEQIFRKLKREGHRALIPYIMSGDPSIEHTKNYIIDLEKSGADIIELGVPFSDPLADGPTIQRAAERALFNGVTLKKVINTVKEIRKVSSIPLILMTYYNPVYKYGVETFITNAVNAGVDGVIIPDLIPDEADDFIKLARKYRLDTVFLLAPTSTQDRIKKVIKASTGFIYFVSITGITGSKLSVSNDMKKTLKSIQNMTQKNVAVGFGISNPGEASAVASLADGVIVGSAIVRLTAQGRDIKRFVKRLRNAI